MDEQCFPAFFCAAGLVVLLLHTHTESPRWHFPPAPTVLAPFGANCATSKKTSKVQFSVQVQIWINAIFTQKIFSSAVINLKYAQGLIPNSEFQVFYAPDYLRFVFLPNAFTWKKKSSDLEIQSRSPFLVARKTRNHDFFSF